MRGKDEFAERLQRRADRISALILFSDLPWIDIELEIQALRGWVEEQAPEKTELFDRVYESRFRRLRAQWGREREQNSAPPPPPAFGESSAI